MSAAYDSFDYPSYWIEREYEHKSEILAIKSFLAKIKKIKVVLEVGGGFGRLVPTYSFRAKKVIITDPSARSLKVARETFKLKKNIKYIHSSLENLPSKVRASSVDLIVMIRVIHHLKDLDMAFKVINRTLTPGGYLILEFANKRHLKAAARHIIKGNLSFLLDHDTYDIRSRKSIKMRTLPFLNYHPVKIKSALEQHGFTVIEKRSVSNFRSTLLKRVFSTELLVFLESGLQRYLSFFDLGPSIFVLVRKKG